MYGQICKKKKKSIKFSARDTNSPHGELTRFVESSKINDNN